MPKKPNRPFVSIAFSKSGKVSKKVEPTAPDTAQIELRVSRALLSVLVERGLPKVLKVERGAEPADVTVQLTDGRSIDIQVVEVVDPVLIRAKEITDSYTAAIRAQHPEILAALRGILVSIITRPDDPQLPRLSSKAGASALRALLDLLREEAQAIGSLPRGKRRNRKREISEQDVFLSFEHLSDSEAPAEIHWPAGRYFKPGEPRTFATTAIAGKIDKHYSKPANPFWLLLFATDTIPLTENDPDCAAARLLLSTVNHPFDEVWWIYPLPNRDSGAVLKIWPAEAAKPPDELLS